MINSHVHSKYSVDSNEEIERICQQAILKGVKGIAITDHVPFWRYGDNFTTDELVACKQDIFNLREKYKNKLKILFGMEISEYHYNDAWEKIALSVGEFDVVLCSLHDEIYIKSKTLNNHFMENDFTTFTNEEILETLKEYYSILNKNYSYRDIINRL